MDRSSLRDKSLTPGMRTVHDRGFATTDLREITAAAGVAQGSFINPFAPKEEFRVAVLDHCFDGFRTIIASTLEDADRAPIDRLKAIFDAITDLFAEAGWRHGCLAGNRGLEAAEHSGAIRSKLVDVLARWTPPFAAAIRQAHTAGDVAPDLKLKCTCAPECRRRRSRRFCTSCDHP